MTRIVNKRQLSDFLGYSEVTLTAWQGEDPPLPVQRHGINGAENAYSTADVITWLLRRAARKACETTPRDRLYHVDAQLRELALAHKRGELVPAADVEAAWTALVLAARKALLALPGPLAQRLEVSPGVEKKRHVLREEIDRALAGLASGDDLERLFEEYVARFVQRVAAAAELTPEQDANE